MSLLGKNSFSSTEPMSNVPACGLCKLYTKCKSPKMPVYGKGGKGVLLVGNSPGEDGDDENKPFTGNSGRVLREELDRLGVDLKKDCWSTNSLICKTQGDKLPTDKQVEYCRPNLLNTIKELNPKVVVLLGPSAIRSLIGYLFREDPGGVTRWMGWKIPCMKFDAWICPTYHPSFLLREEYRKGPDVAMLYFRKHLKGAFNLKKTPWGGSPPDYRRQVVVCHDHQKAAAFLRQFRERDHRVPLAYDYETDRLKPDSEGSKILCCAMSDGSTSVAFPWVGEAVKEAEKILSSRIPKVCHNSSFERRWTRKVLGFWPSNVMWDTMLVAHVLDNRSDITGLKFQALIKLGQEPDTYDKEVKPYMESEGSNLPNRLKEFDRGKLLLYCGLDALLTAKLAKIQMKEVGYETQ